MSSVIREMQRNLGRGSKHISPVRSAVIKRIIADVGEEVGKEGLLCSAGGNVNECS